jgi:DNA-binding beta-propeller fold protein YncE
VLGSLATVTWSIGRGERFPLAAAQGGSQTAVRRPLVLDRAPVRLVSDPNPVFNGIAIDAARGEVFMTNDKESAEPSVVVYPTQFQPTDRVLEPRRRIAGPKTNMSLPCGVAISPQFQEVYTVTGDGQSLNVFPVQGAGNIAPSRELDLPHASGGVFLDATNDELFVTTEHSNRISAYRRAAEGDADPERFIQGPKTELADPHGIYVDAERNEVFVTNHGHWRKTETGEAFALRGDGKFAQMRGSFSHAGPVEPLGPSSGKFLPPSVTVYSRTAQGDVAPLRIIQGAHTRLNQPLGIIRDPVSGELVVANTGDDAVLFFGIDGNGDVAPRRVIQGPATQLNGPTGVAIDPQHKELWVTSWDNHMTMVFPEAAQGNATPLRYIRSAPKDAILATMGRLGAVEYDPKRKEILMPN